MNWGQIAALWVSGRSLSSMPQYWPFTALRITYCFTWLRVHWHISCMHIFKTFYMNEMHISLYVNLNWPLTIVFTVLEHIHVLCTSTSSNNTLDLLPIPHLYMHEGLIFIRSRFDSENAVQFEVVLPMQLNEMNEKWGEMLYQVYLKLIFSAAFRLISFMDKEHISFQTLLWRCTVYIHQHG